MLKASFPFLSPFKFAVPTLIKNNSNTIFSIFLISSSGVLIAKEMPDFYNLLLIVITEY
jgi:hypothetical protein